ncbi:ScbR family autoregulator-binding transcription factor [Streptomyces globisporus]|uniref:ScbR family autoregulator-binding transcription factor n=1 Tax=Streptomyces globisporus TaxID=1908 RepID=UPI0036DD0D41
MNEPEPARRRAPQKRSLRTHEAILEAAGQVFDEHGYVGATLKMILSRTGGEVTKGGLYHHFRSKEQLAQEIMQIQVPMSTLPAQQSKIQELVDTSFFFVFLLLNNPLARAGARLSTDGGLPPSLDATGVFRAWASHAELLIRQAAELKQTLPGTEPDQISEVLVGSYVGIQLTSKAFDDRRELPRRISLFWRLILPGIAAPGLLPTIDYAPDRMDRLFPANSANEAGTDEP